MSHWAKVEKGIVTQVLVGDNELPDEGQSIVESLGGTWVKTSYNGTIRKNFAGIGYTYDPVRDAFIPPKANCHPEEIFDEETCRWICSNPEHNEVTDGNN